MDVVTKFAVNGGYSAWEPYGECSKSCGGGKQTRSRTCTNPPPAAGGAECSKLGSSTQSRECNNQNCPSEFSVIFFWACCSDITRFESQIILLLETHFQIFAICIL